MGLAIAALKRMELRGEVRQGYFVRGLAGPQFALPEALEALRDDGPSEHAHLLSALDPANAYAGLLPSEVGAPRISRLPGQYAVIRDGRLLLAVEAGGRRLEPASGASPRDGRAVRSPLGPAPAGPAPAHRGRNLGRPARRRQRRGVRALGRRFQPRYAADGALPGSLSGVRAFAGEDAVASGRRGEGVPRHARGAGERTRVVRIRIENGPVRKTWIDRFAALGAFRGVTGGRRARRGVCRAVDRAPPLQQLDAARHLRSPASGVGRAGAVAFLLHRDRLRA